MDEALLRCPKQHGSLVCCLTLEPVSCFLKLEVSIFELQAGWSPHSSSALLWVMYLQTRSKGEARAVLWPAPREVLANRRIII